MTLFINSLLCLPTFQRSTVFCDRGRSFLRNVGNHPRV